MIYNELGISEIDKPISLKTKVGPVELLHIKKSFSMWEFPVWRPAGCRPAVTGTCVVWAALSPAVVTDPGLFLTNPGLFLTNPGLFLTNPGLLLLRLPWTTTVVEDRNIRPGRRLWFSARLWYLWCISIGDTTVLWYLQCWCIRDATVLHWAIDIHWARY